jgi:hypothetical protein
MSGVPLETCWAFNERWNNKFCYKVASCWLFLLSHKKLELYAHYNRRLIRSNNTNISTVPEWRLQILHSSQHMHQKSCP